MTDDKGPMEGRPQPLSVQRTLELMRECADAIHALFKPEAKVTIYVRHPAYPDGSRDVVVTDDDPRIVAAELAKAKLL